MRSRRNSALRAAVALLLGLAMLPNTGVGRALAQPRTDDAPAPYALIFGTVWGADNRPVYGVPVKIRLAEKKKARWELTSDHHGEFAQRVPAGKADYVVWADVKVTKGAAKPQVLVHIENDERKDVGLHLTE
jgi:hypothetical protein